MRKEEERIEEKMKKFDGRRWEGKMECHVNFHTLDRDKKARRESKRERKRRKKERKKEREGNRKKKREREGEREKKKERVDLLVTGFFSKPSVFTLIISLLCSITEKGKKNRCL